MNLRVAGWLLHRLAQLAVAATLLLAIGAGALAWRLAQEPIHSQWLAKRIEAAAASRGLPVHVADASLAWAGFNAGAAAPIALHLARVAPVAEAGASSSLHVDSLTVTASLPALLAGSLAPEAIDVDGLQLALLRGGDGAIAVAGMTPSAARPTGSGPGEGTPQGLLHAVATPPDKRGRLGPLSDLRHIGITAARITVRDAASGRVASLDPIDARFDRNPRGEVNGRATIAVQSGDQHATLTLDAAIDPGGRATDVAARMTPINPARLAALIPTLSPLAGLDAPVTLAARAELGPDLRPRAGHADLRVGGGLVHAGTGSAPLLGADLAADLTLNATTSTLKVRLARLETAASPAGQHTTFTGTVVAAREQSAIRATVSMDVDHVSFADLPALWPAGTGGPGSRPWITENITGGQLEAGHLDLALTTPEDLSSITVTSINAHIDGHDLTVHWLPPVPPLIHGEGRLTVTDPDAIDVALFSAEQAGGTQGGVQYRDGLVHITQIAEKDQFADIRTKLVGPVADLLAVLNNPRVKLLQKRPVPMRNPAGTFTADLTVDHLPLKASVQMDDLAIATKGHFSDVHLGGIAGGRDLDRGNIDLSANNDGLRARGRAVVASIPAQLGVDMDFRTGPPTQVQQKVTVAARLDPALLSAHGVAVGSMLTGSAPINATLVSLRSGVTSISVAADLTPAGLDLPRIPYSKPAGARAGASIKLRLEHDRLAAVDALHIEGPGLLVDGSADVAGGRPSLLRLARVDLGEHTDAHGTVALPAGPGQPYVVSLAGSSLDVSGALKAQRSAGPKLNGSTPPGQAWKVSAAFDQVIFRPGHALRAMTAQAASDGREITQAKLSARAARPDGQTAASLEASLTPAPGGRQLQVRADDAGAVLRASGLFDGIASGNLALDGIYADQGDQHVLTGRLTMRSFRVRGAPIIGKVLQGMTLYGLVDALQGPGLLFTNLIAPFRLEPERLTLTSARAFSASLGLTGQGTVDLATERADLSGTIVPAYIFNTLPSYLPLVGHIFSPEKGGGVFAATYTVRGPLADPSVGVNPLAVLTPGFLRGVFGLFNPGR